MSELVDVSSKIGIGPGQPNGSKTVKVKCRMKKKKVEVLTIQEVDRSVYDPKTNKWKSLPNKKPVVVHSIPLKTKRRGLNLFEKMIGFHLDYHGQADVFMKILEQCKHGAYINPERRIIENPFISLEFFIGCYAIAVQILLEKHLITNKMFPHYPSLTKKGERALKFLKGFCDDKCCHGC